MSFYLSMRKKVLVLKYVIIVCAVLSSLLLLSRWVRSISRFSLHTTTASPIADASLSSRLRPEDEHGWQAMKRITASLKLDRSTTILGGLNAVAVEIWLPKEWSENSVKNFPILIFLHGRGESGDFKLMNSQSLPRLLGGDVRSDSLHHGPNKTFAALWPFITLMPQCPQYCARQNGWKTREFEALLELIHAAADVLHGDKHRVYLAGQSMGGAGAWEFAAYSPSTFAAVMVMCGYCPLHTVTCADDIAAKLRNMPVWIFHGQNDIVIPVEAADKMSIALKQAGNTKFRYSRYQWAPPPPDPRYKHLSGHAVHDLAFVERELPGWLLQFSS